MTLALYGPEQLAQLRKAAMTDEETTTDGTKPPGIDATVSTDAAPEDVSEEQLQKAADAAQAAAQATISNPGDGGVVASATGVTEEAKPEHEWSIREAWNTLIERLGFHDLAAPAEDDADPAQPA